MPVALAMRATGLSLEALAAEVGLSPAALLAADWVAHEVVQHLSDRNRPTGGPFDRTLRKLMGVLQ